MHFEVLSIFPELFESFSKTGLFGKGVKSGAISFSASQLREHAVNSQGQIDDAPYGGGSGMVLRIETAEAAIRKERSQRPESKVVLMTPRGEPMSQKLARKIVSENSALTILCGRYEGVDERIAEELCDYQVSMGDFITMGGETPAMAFMESVARLVPGVLGNPESLSEESFENMRLEHPQYTRPEVFKSGEKELAVPKILLSGNHKKIDEWRKEKAIRDTFTRRPDLARGLDLDGSNVSIALIHYPVFNKEGKIITSSLTNLDLSDIARSVKTFGVKKFYIVHPAETLRKLAFKICEHWNTGYGSSYNPNRGEALEQVSILPQFKDALEDAERVFGEVPSLVTTSAKPGKHHTSYLKMREIAKTSDKPLMILFGTGWGLADEVMEKADFQLPPINGCVPYNHLSVRAAAAITLDRLFSKH